MTAITMTKKVWKTGSSLVVSIDKNVAEAMKLKKGDMVSVRIEKVE